jgi:hypothetical protein
VPEVQAAIEAYRAVTADAEFQRLIRLREDAAHNEASALAFAKEEGLKLGADNKDRDMAIKLM